MRRIVLLFILSIFSFLVFNSCGTSVPASNSNSTSSGTSSSGGGGFVLDVLGSLLGDYASLKQADLYGTWNYTGTDCRFKSENLLKKAGGEVAAKEIESQLDDAFGKMGIKSGACSFTFKDDNTFSAVLGTKKISGSYTIDEANKKIVLTYLMGIANLEANVVKSGQSMSLLFDADKILSLLNMLASVSNNTYIKSIGTLASQYDGLLVGFQMKK